MTVRHYTKEIMYSQGWLIGQSIYVCGLLARYLSDYFLRTLSIIYVVVSYSGASEGLSRVGRRGMAGDATRPTPQHSSSHNIIEITS